MHRYAKMCIYAIIIIIEQTGKALKFNGNGNRNSVPCKDAKINHDVYFCFYIWTISKIF